MAPQQRDRQQSTNSPSISHLRGMAHINPLYETLAGELSGLREYDLFGRVKMGALQKTGGYSSVHDGTLEVYPSANASQGSSVATEIRVAVKCLRFLTNADIKAVKGIVRELKIWTRLRHENILPCQGFAALEGMLCFVSEWMGYGNVREYASRYANVDIEQLVRGIATGLEYLHSQDMVHSDLKSDNVLVNHNGKPVLTDFGISRVLGESGTLGGTTSLKGSTRWMAAELMNLSPSTTGPINGDGNNNQLHTKETDIWAFGMVIYEIITGKLPFHELKNDAAVVMSIVTRVLPDVPPQDKQNIAGFEFLWKLCKDCWANSPAERPTIKGVLDRFEGFDAELSITHTFEAHSDGATCVAFSAVDTLILATSSLDKTVCIWKLSEDGNGATLCHRLAGHTSYVKYIAWSSDAQSLFSGSFDKTVRKWDPSTGACKFSIDTPSFVCSVALSPDNEHIASGGDNSICVWSASSGKKVMALSIPLFLSVLTVTYSPNGKHLVSTSIQGSIDVWDPNTGQKLFTAEEGRSLWIQSLSYHPSGKAFVTGSFDKTITVWDADTVKVIYERPNAHSGPVTSMRYSPNGNLILSASEDKTSKLWDSEKGEVVSKSAMHSQQVWTAIFSPNARWVVSGGGYSGLVTIWSLKGCVG